MTTLHVGLIGCGIWGANILRDLRSLGATVSVVDPAARARDIAADHGAAIFADLDSLPATDGLIVATPATTHAEVIDRCLARAVPIFTEKPFTLDLASAQALARAAPDRLFVMHVWRYHPGVAALRDLLAEARFGPADWLRLTRANWTSPRTDVDSVWTMLPHDVSILLELLGELPPPRSAVAEWHGDTPTGIVALLGDRPSAVIETSTRHELKRREVRLHCREAVVVLRGTSPDALEIYRGVAPGIPAPSPERLPIDTKPALVHELETFLNHLRGGPAPKSNMTDALKITGTVLEIRRMAGL